MSKFTDLMTALTRDAGLAVTGSLESPLTFTVGEMAVTLSSETHFEVESIVFHADLGEVLPARELEIYRLLLEANVLWSATAFATLGVNSATRGVVLCYRCEAEALTGESLAAVLSAFIETATTWRAIVADQNTAAEPLALSSDDRHGGMIRI